MLEKSNRKKINLEKWENLFGKKWIFLDKIKIDANFKNGPN